MNLRSAIVRPCLVLGSGVGEKDNMWSPLNEVSRAIEVVRNIYSYFVRPDKALLAAKLRCKSATDLDVIEKVVVRVAQTDPDSVCCWIDLHPAHRS